MNVGLVFFPGSDRHRLNIFMYTRNIGSDAQQGVFKACNGQRIEKLQVAVRGFNEDLCLILFPGCPFKFPYLFHPHYFIGRQVAGKTEILSIEPRCHECKQDGGWTGQRDDPDAGFMGRHDDPGTRIGYTGNTGFGKKADVVSIGSASQEIMQIDLF